MKILVTGGSGFIGRNFISYLLKKKIKVLNVDKITYASKAFNFNLKKNKYYFFHKTDINNLKQINHLLNDFKPDKIIHLAAESHVDNSIINSKEFINSNILGTYNFLQESLKFWEKIPNLKKKKFVFHHVSTDEVFGFLKIKDLPFDENSNYNPSSPYSSSKASSDFLVRSWNKTYGLPVVITNSSNNYGPWQHPEKFIPKIILCCITKTKIPIYGKGNQIRDWIHVSDHVSALYKVLFSNNYGKTYNIGAKNERTNIQIARFICSYFNKLNNDKFDYIKLIEFIKDRPGHDFRYAIDNRKIIKDLKWLPTIDFENGIRNTVDWYLQQYTLNKIKYRI